MHSHERYKTSSTVQLMAQALPNCEVRMQGRPQQPLNFEDLADPEREVLLLYPETSAAPLTKETAASFARPVTLVVPDGTWNQARKIAAHASAVPGVRRVKVASEVPSRYYLRTPDRAARLCTLEAVARALGALESETVQRSLEELLDQMVKRVLMTRSSPLAKRLFP
jgi:DTW domain-containing protein YfiP